MAWAAVEYAGEALAQGAQALVVGVADGAVDVAESAGCGLLMIANKPRCSMVSKTDD